LYPAHADCVRSGDLDAAVELYAFATAFGDYDTKRVADTSAHQAIGALQARYLWTLPEDRKLAFVEYLETSAAAGTKLGRRVCAELRRVGPPAYEPLYMIRHGMNAVLGSGPSAPPDGFSQDVAWASVLESEMKCE
jgi:hypothetical protein